MKVNQATALAGRNSAAHDRVPIEKYLHMLCDPNTHEPLALSDPGQPTLCSQVTGTHYRFIGAHPDLRPWAGSKTASWADTAETAAATIQNQRRVAEHYDDKPCNNYLCLDNIPLGKYLRDRAYDHYFRNARTVIEVGCGKGAIARALKEHRGVTPFCVDLAYGSIARTRDGSLNADGVLGSNLCLPLRDQVADLVISYGVIHHTPNPFQCFRELARILKPGGHLLLGVYNWQNLYRKLYHAFNPTFTAPHTVLGERLGNLLLQGTVFPPYHLALWFVLGMTQGKWAFPPLRDSWEQFGDFFLTPIAQFYHAEELSSMGEALNLRMREHETGGWPQNGFSHFCWYQKIV